MALKDKITSILSKLPFKKLSLSKLRGVSLSKRLRFRLFVAALAALCLTLTVLLWLSGKPETNEAFNGGRRLLIRLDNGIILGKQTTIQKAAPVLPPPTVPVTPAQTTPTPNAPSLADTTPSVQPSASALPPANPALMDKDEVPVIGQDGTKPWKFYAKPYERKGSLPMIAIIVTGLGESKTASDSAIKLPENVTLSFSPYAANAKSWATAARLAGHEVLVDLPMETAGFPASDPGPHALLTGKAQDDNMQRLRWLMSRFCCYTGFLAPPDEVFSSDIEGFKAVLLSMANHGLLLVMGHEPAKDDVKAAITTAATPNVTIDVQLDEELSAASIQARLVALEQAAKSRGYAIGAAGPYPLSVQEINAWAAKLAEDGFVLVPVSFIAKLKFS